MESTDQDFLTYCKTKNPTLTLKRVPIDENLDLLESSDVGGNKLATKEQLEEFNSA